MENATFPDLINFRQLKIEPRSNSPILQILSSPNLSENEIIDSNNSSFNSEISNPENLNSHISNLSLSTPNPENQISNPKSQNPNLESQNSQNSNQH